MASPLKHRLQIILGGTPPVVLSKIAKPIFSFLSCIPLCTACLPATAAQTNLANANQAIDQICSTAIAAANLQPTPAQAVAQTAAPASEEATEVFEQNGIVIKSPALKALITLTEGLNPLELDADGSQPIVLRDALLSSLNHNLDIGISSSNSAAQHWNYIASLGHFLPDALTSYNDQYLRGRITAPFGNIPVQFRFHNPFIIANAGFRLWGYQGGKVLFGALQSRHNYRAARAGQKATISDVLLDVANKYYNLVLNEALLQIRIQAVQTSVAQLEQNTALHEDGLATNLDVLQAKTQLSRDRQSLIDQQIARRNASLQLAHVLNADMAMDLTPADHLVKKIRLVSGKLQIGELLKIAIQSRPELKQYEELRLAARRAIVVASAPLQPRFQFTGNIYGIGQTLGKDATLIPASFQPVVVAGAPLATSPLAPIPTGLGTAAAAAGAVFPVGATLLPPQLASRQIAALYTLGFKIDWDFSGLGVPDMANIEAAKYAARQAHLQATKELLDVLEQVRSSYLNSLSAEKKVDEASDEVASTDEELRLAQLRFQNGLGTNLDIIQAQRDNTSALITKAQAIVNFNMSQAQLLHDIGMISVDALTTNVPFKH